MDELSLSWHLEPRGTVLRAYHGGIRVRSDQRRARCTCIASISSDHAFNLLLPTIFVGNTHQFDLSFTRTARARYHSLFVWRERSAWMTHQLMQRYLEVLAALPRDKPLILLCDMCPSHLGLDIFTFAQARGVRMVMVPTHLTCLLQPLDVCVFRSFRCAIERRWNEARSRAPQGELSKLAWLEVVAGAVQAVLREKEWRRAFLTTGIMEKQEHVLKAELEELRQQRAHLRQQIKVNRAQTKDANRRKKKLLKAARQLNVEDLKSLVALKAAD
ncbi:unnamed protein product [Effrenium voratum]|uniref:DDE-1 domain-containing protein n=2 Tax=Effrenium voratum TaxID=2562239 RepID=A0AA36I9M4_9DINO|nr:unnamed protein product [Effrenium voratum]